MRSPLWRWQLRRMTVLCACGKCDLKMWNVLIINYMFNCRLWYIFHRYSYILGIKSFKEIFFPFSFSFVFCGMTFCPFLVLYLSLSLFLSLSSLSPPSSLNTRPNNHLSLFDRPPLPLSSFLSPSLFSPFATFSRSSCQEGRNLTCTEMKRLPLLQFLGAGLHKASYLTQLNNHSLVLRIATHIGLNVLVFCLCFGYLIKENIWDVEECEWLLIIYWVSFCVASFKHDRWA